MEEIKEKKVKQKKKLSKSAIIVIIGIAILLIPVLVFVGILGISALQTGSPRDGSRFDGDLVNEITNDDVASIQASLETIGSIDSVEVKLSEGQLKVFIDTNDSLSEEQVDSIVSDAYTKVTSKLPVTTYFTKGSAKMYDLEINVYTTIEDQPNRQYKFLHKNSAEENFAIDDLAHAKDESVAAEVRGDVVEEPTDDVEGETE